MEQQKPSSEASSANAATDANGASQKFFAQAQQMWTPMTETMQEQRALLERGLDDLAKAQEANLRRTREAADEMTDVVKASINYTTQLTHEWIALNMSAMHRTMGAFNNSNR